MRDMLCQEQLFRHLIYKEQAGVESRFSNFDMTQVLPGLYTNAVQPLMLLTPPQARAATFGAYTIAE